MGPAFLLRCSHSFQTFSSQKQGAYEQPAAAGSSPGWFDRNDDDGGDPADEAAAPTIAPMPPPPPLDEAAGVGAGREGDLLGLLQQQWAHPSIWCLLGPKKILSF